MGFLARLFGTENGERNLLADLALDYRAEAEQAAILRAHAERARYPQVATALRQLAAEEDRHAAALRDRLLARGGTVPAVEAPRAGGDSQWQRVVEAHRRAVLKRRRLVEQVAAWDPDEPEIVALLQRIEHEDQRQLAIYDGIVMRSDPQALD
jgi:rubrerythrin